MARVEARLRAGHDIHEAMIKALLANETLMGQEVKDIVLAGKK